MNKNQIKYRQYFIEQLEKRNYDIERTIIAINKDFANMPNTIREAHNQLSTAERNEIIREVLTK